MAASQRHTAAPEAVASSRMQAAHDAGLAARHGAAAAGRQVWGQAGQHSHDRRGTGTAAAAVCGGQRRGAGVSSQPGSGRGAAGQDAGGATSVRACWQAQSHLGASCCQNGAASRQCWRTSISSRRRALSTRRGSWTGSGKRATASWRPCYAARW